MFNVNTKLFGENQNAFWEDPKPLLIHNHGNGKSKKSETVETYFINDFQVIRDFKIDRSWRL